VQLGGRRATRGCNVCSRKGRCRASFSSQNSGHPMEIKTSIRVTGKGADARLGLANAIAGAGERGGKQAFITRGKRSGARLY